MTLSLYVISGWQRAISASHVRMIISAAAATWDEVTIHHNRARDRANSRPSSYIAAGAATTLVAVVGMSEWISTLLPTAVAATEL